MRRRQQRQQNSSSFSRSSNDNAAAPRGWDEPHTDRAALAMDLHRHGVGLTNAVTPIATADWDEVHLRSDDTAPDGSCDLLGALGAQPDVTVLVADEDVADEAVGLAGAGHLLHGVDLHDLVLEGTRLEELVDDLIFLDWKRVQVDILNGVDLPILHQTAQLGNWDPLLFLALALALSLLALALA
eukprot:CAMPEP_0115414108 /NCGR_PEP_ID=MMETSP0271-20121206/22415_1 /TAXON_ID=71861 /ORGANISM="Scrippsiella trochoidea, Strain CCMP3099" /LENGTH=184 /DNA_ID=CAMNT_0002838407 /DNA_START=218 /DNA_END=770 /DNA_ORIENTATION=-